MHKLDEIIRLSGCLKGLKRSGWLRKNIQECETVAAHSWGVAFLALLLAPQTLDLEKCLKFAVIHDLQEVEVGDITPFDGVSREEKARREKQAVCKLSEELDFPELKKLFDEYEENKTPEARFIHDVDRLDAVLLAKYYDDNKRGNGDAFSEFYKFALTHLSQDANGIRKIFTSLGDVLD